MFYQTTSASVIDSKTNSTPSETILLRLGLRGSFDILIKIHCAESAWECVLYFSILNLITASAIRHEFENIINKAEGISRPEN